MNASPTVSVVMVFHRDTPFFRPAIRSVVEQTLSDWELILVDNGSGLSRGELGAELASDERLRWLSLPRNVGIPGGHNAGLSAARGEFIALLDYDDLMLPHRLARQVEALRQDPQLGLVSARTRRIDEAGTIVGSEFSLTDSAEAYAYSHYAAPFPTPACLGRRELFLQLPYREAFPFAADFDFQARAAERAKVVALSEVLLHYRWYGSQTTQSKAGEIEQSRAAIRLMTARRRSGKDERFAEATSGLDPERADASQACQIVAEKALAEGLFSTSSYHARRMLVYRRTPARLMTAVRLGARAIAAARVRERRLAARLWFTGPVKALALRSHREEERPAPSDA